MDEMNIRKHVLYNRAGDLFMEYVDFRISEDKIDNAATKVLVFF